MTIRERLRRRVLRLLGYYLEPTREERLIAVVGRAGVLRVTRWNKETAPFARTTEAAE